MTVSRDKSSTLRAQRLFENDADEVARVMGRWGCMYINYEDWNVSSWDCRLCDFRSLEEEKTNTHAEEAHTTKEKLEFLADFLDVHGGSRIDRFKRVMKMMENRDWGTQLTAANMGTKMSEVEESAEYLE